MVAPGPVRNTRKHPRMSVLIEEFAARDEISRFGGEAQRIECRAIDPLETNLIAYAGKKNLRAPWIVHLDRRAADPVPAGRHRATGDQRLPARDEQGSGGAGAL